MVHVELSNNRSIKLATNGGVIRPSLGAGPQGLPGPGAAAWTALQAVTTGSVRQAPDGSWIKSVGNRTTRASFDATEQTFWTTVLGTPGTLEAADLSASTAQIVAGRISGRRGMGTGDSITAAQAVEGAVSGGGSIRKGAGDNWWNIACAATDGAVHNLGIVAQPGATTALYLTDIQPTVLALTGAAKPDFVAVLIGTNDAIADVAPATIKANLTTIYENYQAAGIQPVPVILPPNSTSDAVRKRVRAVSIIVSALASDMKLPLLDGYSALADATTYPGDWLTNYNDDVTHPSRYGHNQLGLAVATQLETMVSGAPLYRPGLGDLNDLLNNQGFFTNGTPIGDGWADSGTLTPIYSVETAAGVIGKRQVMSDGDPYLRYTTASVPSGHRVRLSGRLWQASTLGNNAGIAIQLYTASQVLLCAPVLDVQYNVDGLRFTAEAVTPSTGVLRVDINGTLPVGEAKVAEVTLLDLTALLAD